MGHSEGSVRAKACNLIGNLCRHSAFFYKTLVTALLPDATPPATLLARLVALCADDDPPTRKFACFAVGNAAFHSAVLYPHLADSVPLLVSALHDADEKTRANAAGALGNLVRNSSELCALLVTHDVARHLLDLARGDSSNAPRRIALFSLGTLSVYERCRGSIGLLEPPLEATLAQIERAPTGADQQVCQLS
jgi:fused-like protein